MRKEPDGHTNLEHYQLSLNHKWMSHHQSMTFTFPENFSASQKKEEFLVSNFPKSSGSPKKNKEFLVSIIWWWDIHLSVLWLVGSQFQTQYDTHFTTQKHILWLLLSFRATIVTRPYYWIHLCTVIPLHRAAGNYLTMFVSLFVNQPIDHHWKTFTNR